MKTWEFIFGAFGVIGTLIGYLGYRSSVSVKETRTIAIEKFDFFLAK